MYTKTITVYQHGDRVRITKDWRDWKKGDYAIVQTMNDQYGNDSSVTLTPEDPKKTVDFCTLQLSYVEYVEPYVQVTKSQIISAIGFALLSGSFDRDEIVKEAIEYLKI